MEVYQVTSSSPAGDGEDYMKFYAEGPVKDHEEESGLGQKSFGTAIQI